MLKEEYAQRFLGFLKETENIPCLGFMNHHQVIEWWLLRDNIKFINNKLSVKDTEWKKLKNNKLFWCSWTPKKRTFTEVTDEDRFFARTNV